jgi:ribosomal protein L32
MSGRLPLAIAIVAVVAVVVVGWLFFWSPANNDNFPQGTLWLCTNQSCGNSFTLTMKELSDHQLKHYGQLPKCPKCGHEALGAERCQFCGKVFVQQRGYDVCPYCGKQQVPKPE